MDHTPDQPEKSTDGGGHFARFNALVRGGWLGTLSPTALRLLIAIESHADADGYAHPGSHRLSSMIGQTTPEGVRRARRELVDCGWIQIVTPGVGTTPIVYRVLTPLPVKSTPTQQNDSPSKSRGQYPSVSRGESPSKWLGQSPSNPPPKLPIEQPSELPIEQPKGAGASVVTVPAILNTPKFKQAWKDWESYRTQRHLPMLKPQSVTKQLDRLAAIGDANAIACINDSIANGWQGLFPEKFTKGNQNGRSDSRKRREFEEQLDITSAIAR